MFMFIVYFYVYFMVVSHTACLVITQNNKRPASLWHRTACLHS